VLNDTSKYLDKIYHPDLRRILRRCYQCGRCSGVCQLSKVQTYTPSKIIQLIIEGFEEKVLESETLWDCLTCNQCLKDCPENINFAELVRMARYKMRTTKSKNVDEMVAHKGIYSTISEIMSQPYINPNRSLDWVPKGVKIADKGNLLYYVGCIPYFTYEFDKIDSIALSTLQILSKIEQEPIVLFKEEICCGHDLYWGQGKFEAFIDLAKKNIDMFEKAGISTIVTACAECYRTLKVDYPKLFDDFNNKFDVKHIIEYVYEMWKKGKIEFVGKNESEEEVSFTYHDPCRLSRFLPEDNKITDNVREIFKEFKKLGYNFTEMKHNKANSLCCGVNSFMNCNEKSKALRYKRMLEAKDAGSIMLTSCPKCKIHLSCVQDDYEDISFVEISDFSEFLINHIKVTNPKKDSEVEN
jgi:heterodisulfide reductase subunit D